MGSLQGVVSSYSLQAVRQQAEQAVQDRSAGVQKQLGDGLKVSGHMSDAR